MSLFKPQARITLGLVGIMTSLILLAFFLNIVPDRNSAVMEGRAALAESIAIYSTALVKSAKVVAANSQRLESDFDLLVSRNEDLLSLALRHEGGHLMVWTGDHKSLWVPMKGKYSRDSQVRVPIWSGTHEWGQLELRFKPLPGESGWDVLGNPMFQLVLFLTLAGFIIYYFYLGKVLRQLDPSQAIPGRVRTALDTMAEGLLILDRKEQIVLANQAFSDMVGKQADDLLGYKAGELPWIDKDGGTIEQGKRPWVVALSSGKVKKDRTIRLLLPDKQSRTFKTNCSPVLGEKGKYAGVLISFDDITELEEKEVALRKSKLEAEAANQAKSSFLANMSHEIRTPMNAILGFTDILKRGYVKNEQESLKYLNIIHSSGKNLLEVINDILDLSKVESGHLEIEHSKINPYPLVMEVLQVLKVKSDEKGLDLTLEAAGDLPEKIETDPVRVRQILLNLIGNSIKFTEKGGVTVRCRHENPGANSYLVFDIIDTGIGMSEKALEAIFNPFVQADESITRQFGGTGLGLAISRKFARALGGDITVTSTPGKGSTFTIKLMTGDLSGVRFLAPEDLAEVEHQLAIGEASRWTFEEANVLVVDDGPENRQLVKLLLEDSGLHVDEAENGQVAVEKAGNKSYDVILMDIQMPVMDGFTAAGLLRKDGYEAPLVALTANAMRGFEEECLNAGYSNYLSKPINIDELMGLMGQLLDGEVITGETSLSREEPTKLAPEEAFSFGETIVSSLPSDNEKFRVIILRFIDRFDEQLGAMEKAAQEGDYQELKNLAHWLKGAAGTVGFNMFTEPAEALETMARDENQANIEIMIKTLRTMHLRIVAPESDNE